MTTTSPALYGAAARAAVRHGQVPTEAFRGSVIPTGQGPAYPAASVQGGSLRTWSQDWPSPEVSVRARTSRFTCDGRASSPLATSEPVFRTEASPQSRSVPAHHRVYPPRGSTTRSFSAPTAGRSTRTSKSGQHPATRRVGCGSTARTALSARLGHPSRPAAPRTATATPLLRHCCATARPALSTALPALDPCPLPLLLTLLCPYST